VEVLGERDGKIEKQRKREILRGKGSMEWE